MKDLRLELREESTMPLDCSAIKPECFVGLSVKEIMEFPVGEGRHRGKLGDYFRVSGDVSESVASQRVVLGGSLLRLRRVGEDMAGGEILLEGDCGWHLGEFMHQGRIHVLGNAGSWVGTSMSGGEIVVEGNAGDYIGCARRGVRRGMRGGRIVVEGNAGTEIGYGLSGGEVFVKGVVHSFVGSYACSGKITVGGVVSVGVGGGMRGGVICILDPDFRVPLAFRETGSDESSVAYEGDSSVHGKGSILIQEVKHDV